ncbi:hypothetical protein KAT08_03250 [Candidatus Babeliales bacterium]|nr:hypothetical protein [Candidatus Babeliales bacterium]
MNKKHFILFIILTIITNHLFCMKLPPINKKRSNESSKSSSSKSSNQSCYFPPIHKKKKNISNELYELLKNTNTNLANAFSYFCNNNKKASNQMIQKYINNIKIKKTRLKNYINSKLSEKNQIKLNFFFEIYPELDLMRSCECFKRKEFNDSIRYCLKSLSQYYSEIWAMCPIWYFCYNDTKYSMNYYSLTNLIQKINIAENLYNKIINFINSPCFPKIKYEKQYQITPIKNYNSHKKYSSIVNMFSNFLDSNIIKKPNQWLFKNDYFQKAKKYFLESYNFYIYPSKYFIQIHQTKNVIYHNKLKTYQEALKSCIYSLHNSSLGITTDYDNLHKYYYHFILLFNKEITYYKQNDPDYYFKIINYYPDKIQKCINNIKSLKILLVKTNQLKQHIEKSINHIQTQIRKIHFDSY